MLKWLFRSDPPEPPKPLPLQVWAYKEYAIGHVWAKVVSPYRPGRTADHVVGPFRSEVDCEEFCDRQNTPYGHQPKPYVNK